MELRPGYKQTEVGVIPKDWLPKPIRTFSAFVTKGATPTTYGFRWEDDGVVFLRSECVSDKGLDLAQSMFISREAHAALARGEVRSGDILMTITGNVGRVVQLASDFGYASINQHIARIRVNDPDVSPGFVYHFLCQPRIRAHYASITTGQAYPQISLQQVRETLVSLPRPPEQRAIAGALGDVDALLGALTQLISKKRDLKQAAMQQLLTGQTRLPGFTGEWEVKRLGDLGTWKGGATPSMSNPTYWASGDVPWASSGDIKTNVLTKTAKAITRTAVNESSTTLLQPGGILIVTRSGILRRYLPVARNEIAVAINQDIKALIPDDALSSEFLFHALVHEGPRILASCLKAGTTVESIEYLWLKRFTLSLPTTTDEQTAIAAVLSDMDAELAVLEQRLAKTRALKQGMMQELLTGRTRLV